MNILHDIPYKSQAHFDIHSMSNSYYYIIFRKDLSLELHESDSDDLPNNHSIIISTGLYDSIKKLTISLGEKDYAGKIYKLIARPGYDDTIIFDSVQYGPRIFSGYEIFTRIDKWLVIDWWKENV
jgi:hypothetical protein